MKITRTIISGASALAMLAGSATPALAYINAEAPSTDATATVRKVDLYIDAYVRSSDMATSVREAATSNNTGRGLLSRSKTRAAQRNFRRHILGHLRGSDYRILNLSGDMRRRGLTEVAYELPLSLVQTGEESSDEDQNDTVLRGRPTRRDIRENNHYERMYNLNQ